MNSEITNDYRRFTDPYGLISSNYTDSTGNNIRHTAEYVMACLLNDSLTQEVMTKVRMAMVPCEREPGLLMRNPSGSFGIQTHDDVLAAILIDWICFTGFSRRFLRYGRTRKLWGFIPYFYNSENPGKWNSKGVFLRFQQVIAAAQKTAGEKIPGYRLLWVQASITQGAWGKSPDSKILSWFLNEIFRNHDDSFAHISNAWQIKLLQHYPFGLGEVLSHYFVNKEQPSIKYLMGKCGRGTDLNPDH